MQDAWLKMSLICEVKSGETQLSEKAFFRLQPHILIKRQYLYCIDFILKEFLEKRKKMGKKNLVTRQDLNPDLQRESLKKPKYYYTT